MNIPYSKGTADDAGVQHPPSSLFGMLGRMGPGIIVAGSIVGSGELIATTSVGAETGFTLLWLILIGCAIKVFVQVELGRYTVTSSKTTLDALDLVPGPRLAMKLGNRTIGARWTVILWAIMTFLILAQQGGIIGGVGQALALQFPLTEYGHDHNLAQNELVAQKVTVASNRRNNNDGSASLDELANRIGKQRADHGGKAPLDAHYWATIIAVATSLLMIFGRFGLIQFVSTALVGLFTLLTIITLVMLQRHAGWAVSSEELVSGLSLQLPQAKTPDSNSMATALATFGLIGVGAGELLMYPYWCLEKGYAQFAGPRSDDPAWESRARGWMRVMRFDAGISMVVYTFSTATFFLLGAAVLWRSGLNPEGGEMVRTLSQMYVPVFGDKAAALFLFGAFAVLYSTFFVVTAAFARLIADGLGVMGFIARDPATKQRYVQIIGVIWPLLAVALFWFVNAPKEMVLASGVAQALMLPVIGIAALYFRYFHIDTRLRPSSLWDVCLWISVLGFVIVGIWTIASKLGLA